MSNKAELGINARMENIPEIVEFASKWLHRQGLDDILFAVQTAVDEACTNIIKHAYSGTGGFMTVSCEVLEDCCIITIRDYGVKYDHGSVPAPDVDADWENRRIGGLGLHLMRNLMDDIQYRHDPVQGNILVMKKKTGGGN